MKGDHLGSESRGERGFEQNEALRGATREVGRVRSQGLKDQFSSVSSKQSTARGCEQGSWE